MRKWKATIKVNGRNIEAYVMKIIPFGNIILISLIYLLSPINPSLADTRFNLILNDENNCNKISKIDPSNTNYYSLSEQAANLGVSISSISVHSSHMNARGVCMVTIDTDKGYKSCIALLLMQDQFGNIYAKIACGV